MVRSLLKRGGKRTQREYTLAWNAIKTKTFIVQSPMGFMKGEPIQEKFTESNGR